MAEAHDGDEPHALRLRYQELFEFAPDFQVVTDDRGMMLEANHAAAQLLRYPKDFLVGKPLGMFVAEGHRAPFYERLARLASQPATVSFDSRLGARGQTPDVAVTVAPVRVGGGPLLLRWQARDVTGLRAAEAARADLLRRLATAEEDERRRVARDLHDTVGQLLTALSLGVRAVRDAGPLCPVALERLAGVQQIADELGRVSHEMALSLRPTALDDLGLCPALQAYLAAWSRRTGVEAELHADSVELKRLPPDGETLVYRLVQEALTNVARHARATRASVVVLRHQGHTLVVIEDDGVGFDPEAATNRLGVAGMRERVALAGGTLEIESAPGHGTTLIARIPLAGG